MRNKIAISFLLVIALVSCEQKNINSDIRYEKISDVLVMPKNLETLSQNNDDISQHVDSILTGLIGSEFISTGQKAFDLNGDLVADLGFEIMDLNPYNPRGLPLAFDSLAAAVIPYNVQILDNSTYGYADALSVGELISDNSKWSSTHCILGTFGDVGQFKGQGDKYVGFRLVDSTSYQYGWIKVNCSEQNDTLNILEYAFNQNGGPIMAGQKN